MSLRHTPHYPALRVCECITMPGFNIFKCECSGDSKLGPWACMGSTLQSELLPSPCTLFFLEESLRLPVFHTLQVRRRCRSDSSECACVQPLRPLTVSWCFLHQPPISDAQRVKREQCSKFRSGLVPGLLGFLVLVIFCLFGLADFST